MSPTYEMDEGNLIYVAFANIPKQQVLACYPPMPSRGTAEMVADGLDEIYDDAVKTQYDNNIKKIVLEYHTMYYLADESATAAIIVMIFEDRYPQRLAYSMVQELWKEVLLVITKEGYAKVRPKTLQKKLKVPFSKIFRRYDNATELDDALRLKVKIDNATEEVEDTMHQILDTCLNLEELQEKSQRLKRKAIVMQRDSVSLKQELGARMVFIVIYTVLVVIVVALYIALPILLKQPPKKFT